jgi:AraC-like DNA-binding protein/mannose-6-phosphate isomerase-like protein (cupin superfamily)
LSNGAGRGKICIEAVMNIRGDVRTVSETEWVVALLAQDTEVKVDMHGFPFRFSPPADWDTQEQEISEHLIYFVVRGNCRAEVAGKPMELGVGDLCWVCPEERFRFFAAGADRGPILQRFRLSVWQAGLRLTLPWASRIFPSAEAAAERSRELAEERLEGRFSRERRACLAALFSQEVFDPGPSDLYRLGLSSELQTRITRAVLDEVNFRLAPRDLARIAGLSADYFSRQFRQTFGLSPREWLLKQRLRHAAGLLAETDERISHIAVRLGYPDIYLFSRQFTAEFGVSPRGWRRTHRGPSAQKRILP